MYVAGFVIPVPAGNLEAYKAWAEASAALFREYGCLEIVDSWEDNVPDGQQTDFRRAVAARPNERIVFSWQIWPSKEDMEAAEARIAKDTRFDIPVEIPFDHRRLILGAFTPVHILGRQAGTG
ncbi:DUF1428 domain-containing protein [Leisingera daeponensis]|uniref:DUF1428 domain-containing protein n=1 Tax=Leisingera daeponensis TaxID=405746 RepID=UPI001C9537A4|nr:DUF1428 domain-containing protein [Leisingera daeponensis]MBY6055573.1 DUF1428 domain-containing protein [Leisingera daeponensis]